MNSKTKFNLKIYAWSVYTSKIYITINWLTLRFDIHNYNAAARSTVKLFKPLFQTNLCGKSSITLGAVNAWNKIQTAFADAILKNLTTIQIQTSLTEKYIDKY